MHIQTKAGWLIDVFSPLGLLSSIKLPSSEDVTTYLHLTSVFIYHPGLGLGVMKEEMSLLKRVTVVRVMVGLEEITAKELYERDMSI